jgi:hypothetical protein
VAAESGIADPVGALFQSSYGRGERLIHRRRNLHGRDVFGAFGQVLGFDTGRRRGNPSERRQDHRFEIDSANAAREFLRANAIDEGPVGDVPSLCSATGARIRDPQMALL